MLTRDRLISEYQARSGGFGGLVAVYAGLVGVLALTAAAII